MSDSDEAKRLRYEQFSDIAPEDKVYIVFEGKPKIWYNHPGLAGSESLRHAEEEASRLTEETQIDHTIMVVPKASVEIALVARYHGVVIHAFDEVEKADEER